MHTPGPSWQERGTLLLPSPIRPNKTKQHLSRLDTIGGAKRKDLFLTRELRLRGPSIIVAPSTWYVEFMNKSMHWSGGRPTITEGPGGRVPRQIFFLRFVPRRKTNWDARNGTPQRQTLIFVEGLCPRRTEAAHLYDISILYRISRFAKLGRNADQMSSQEHRRLFSTEICPSRCYPCHSRSQIRVW